MESRQTHISKMGREQVNRNVFYDTSKKTWQCGICRKGFRTKNDLEQHLLSGTHDALRYSCSQCSKGFTSLGAVTLHIEQAGHTDNRDLLKCAQNTFLASVSTTWPNAPHSSLPAQRYMGSSPSNISTASSRSHNSTLSHSQLASDGSIHGSASPISNELNLKHSPSNILNDNFILSNCITQKGPHHYFPSHNICQDRLYILRISSFTERLSLTAGCALVICDSDCGAVVHDSSFVIKQHYLNSLQPEYESLAQGVTDTFNLGIRRVRIITSSELLYRQLAQNRNPSYLQSSYRIVRSLINQVHQLLSQFSHVEAEHQIAAVPESYAYLKARSAFFTHKESNLLGMQLNRHSTISTNSQPQVVGTISNSDLFSQNWGVNLHAI